MRSGFRIANVWCGIGLAVCLAAFPASGSAILWYNGSIEGVWTVVAHGRDLSQDFALYDNFSVPSVGWLVSEIFADNDVWDEGALSTHFLGADYEIRRGLAPGNGGTLVAFGYAVPASWSRMIGPGNGYRLSVTGLSIALGPGEYWLMLRPVFSTNFDSRRWPVYLHLTRGTNGVNAVLDDKWFVYSGSAGVNFRQERFHDTSMGLRGEPLPEPATLGLVACGLALAWARRRVRS
ncbi:MAG: PEP-CTERM sorting domain-containing protein [Bryobacterales bacterium]|nr:PEP-CTERM sorting domain-containing protein [Bryobacteraceae bacterium]MDW8354111.1 PEP-CTERM sorting domain-containing protein [Bryobacterales bacterium]